MEDYLLFKSVNTHRSRKTVGDKREDKKRHNKKHIDLDEDTLKKGSRIKIIGKGDYKGYLGYIHFIRNEDTVCRLDMLPLKKVHIPISRVELIKHSYTSAN